MCVGRRSFRNASNNFFLEGLVVRSIVIKFEEDENNKYSEEMEDVDIWIETLKRPVKQRIDCVEVWDDDEKIQELRNV